MKKRLISLLLAIAAAFGIQAMIAQTANAAASQIIVYNSRSSCGQIEAINWTTGEHYKLSPGRYHAITDRGSAVVDVDVGGEGCDVDSWFKWDSDTAHLGSEPSGTGGNVCYNNEDESSNPYSAFFNQVTGYRTFRLTFCKPG